MRIAVIEEYPRTSPDSDIETAFRKFTEFLEASGATLSRTTVPEMHGAGTLYTAVKDPEHMLLHADLRRVLASVDETTRLNLLTGALLPAHWVAKADRLFAQAREAIRQRFAATDAVVWLGSDGVTPSLASMAGPAAARTPEAVIAGNGFARRITGHREYRRGPGDCTATGKRSARGTDERTGRRRHLPRCRPAGDRRCVGAGPRAAADAGLD